MAGFRLSACLFLAQWHLEVEPEVVLWWLTDNSTLLHEARLLVRYSNTDPLLGYNIQCITMDQLAWVIIKGINEIGVFVLHSVMGPCSLQVRWLNFCTKFSRSRMSKSSADSFPHLWQR
jgi:hypothetical protein